jgi:hypothetical protein
MHHDSINGLAAIAAALMPECAPPYLFDAAALPNDLRVGGVAGWTAPALDLLLAPLIGDLWRGRAAAVVIDFEAVESAYESCAGCSPPLELFTAILIHELAHVAARPPSLTDGATGLARGAERRRAHGLQFARVALHLHRRAATVGADCYACDVLNARGYGLPPVSAMACALGQEFRELAHVPITSLAGIPAPSLFESLFNAHCGREVPAAAAA